MDIKFDTTLERDMDLLIMEEFIWSPLFARIFLDTVGITCDYTIEQVIHSMRDADLGESDIVFILDMGDKRHAIHIEDKIDALAMPLSMVLAMICVVLINNFFPEIAAIEWRY